MDISTSQFLLFLSVTLVLTVTPGVDTFLVLRNVLRGGAVDGFYTAAGICSGLFVHAGLSALGISLILVRSAALFQFVKLAGAVYLAWLGATGLYAAVRYNCSAPSLPDSASTRKMHPARSFREGLLSNVLNPKPAVFYLSFFPQFIGAGDAVFFKSMCLASIQFFVGVCWLFLLSLFISRIKNVIEKPIFQRSLLGLSGGILITLGLKIGFQEK